MKPEFEQFAAKLDEHRAGATTQRILGPDHNKVGLAGEVAFAEMFGLDVNTDLTRRGDGGWDFRTRFWTDHGVQPLTVDVKTSRRGDWLFVKQGTVRADLYVLAKYEASTETAHLLGWVPAQHILSVTPITSSKGMVNHGIPVLELRDIKILQEAHRP